MGSTSNTTAQFRSAAMLQSLAYRYASRSRSQELISGRRKRFLHTLVMMSAT